MAVTGPIPLAGPGFEAFFKQLKEAQENKLNSAKAQREQTLANLPFGGANVPGPAGQIVGLQMVKMLYGPDSPEFKQAEEAFKLSQKSVGSRVDYQNALTGSLPMRYTTPEGRQIIEASNVGQGASPTGSPAGEPVIPGQPGYNPNASTSSSGVTPSQHYGLRQAKQDLPASVMQKNLYVNNIEKTLNDIDLDALTHFNGPKGQFSLKKEQLNDARGQETSPEYKKYKEAEAKFNLLPNQVGQFYGSSVQPSAVEKKTAELDPRGFMQSPKTGKLRFKSSSALLKKELQTYRDASKNANVYTGGQASNENNISGQESPEGTIWMVRPDNVKVPVHKENVETAKSKYKYREVE